MKKLTAQALAWIAESADGTRDKDLVIVYDGERYFLMEESQAEGRQVILEIRTSSRKKQEPTQRTITIPRDWDALFLSESAFEKFLVPYYVAHRLLSDEEMNDLRTRYYGGTPDAVHGLVLGVVHKPPTRSYVLYEDYFVEPIRVGGEIPFEIPMGLLEDDAGGRAQ